MASTTIAPAPWHLSGRGAVLLYHFTHNFNARYGFMEEYQRQGYLGWLGAVMMVDYTASNVGPYQELLFIPGLFRLGGRWSFSVSKIFVSTEDSMLNGQRNWGIPKELAKFDVKQQAGGSQHFRVSKNSTTFFEASLKTGGFSLPFWSRLLPLTRITQQALQQLLFTRIQVQGHTQFAKLQKITSDEDYFPPLQGLRPLLALSVKDFQMTFPQPEVLAQRR
ncbi:acetoacetate decarboxylase family protein [Cesiribacter sp. SM1]|uniref:acetoacetate decarboxylase family protein n=1 Tax=Cesiribacter sp. SM1 TaxID=2861196 RepID=UPI001CD1A1A7|nr:acetoacetate decarboxylase family protein [Cesiribacter sp. SM1]